MEALAGLRLLSIGTHAIGAVHDQRGRTLTAALSLRGQGFALLGPDEQDRRVAAWSSVLATLAREGSHIRRVQWLAASFPDQGYGVHNFVSTNQRADPDSACVASYESLLTDIDADACTHDVVLTVQVRLTKSVEAGAAILQREMGSLTRLLADADIVVEGVLGAEDFIARLLRTYEPFPKTTEGTEVQGDPWPMAMEEEWAQRPHRRAAARHVLGGGVAPHRSAERFPRAVAARLGPCRLVRGDGASRAGEGRAQSRGLAHRRFGRRRTAPPQRLHVDGPALPRVRGAWPGARANWPTATRRSAIRVSSPFLPLRPPNWLPLVTPCSTRRARPAWSFAVSTATRPAPTRARCRWLEASPDGDGSSGASGHRGIGASGHRGGSPSETRRSAATSSRPGGGAITSWSELVDHRDRGCVADREPVKTES